MPDTLEIMNLGTLQEFQCFQRDQKVFKILAVETTTFS